MAVLVVLALVLLGLLPVGAALAGLEREPGVLLETLASPRVLGLCANTLWLGLLVAAGCAALGLPVGYALAHRRGRGAALLAGLLILPLVLPPWMSGMAWTRLLPLSGLGGAALLLTLCLWPLVALFALRGFRSAAPSGDAARLLRGRRAALLRVELPLAAPSVLSGMLLAFVFAITDFAVVDLLSFTDPEPLVVLSSEIFQQWSKLGSSVRAAAVSLPTVLFSLAALAGLVALERRHEGTFAGGTAGRGTPRSGTGAGTVGLAATAALCLAPVAVLIEWASRNGDPGAALAQVSNSALRSVGVGLATGAVVAWLGVAVARQSLRLGPRGTWLLLSAALLPLAAPGVMLAVGEIRLWHHPANPLGLAVYTSPALLVLATSARFLPLGVLAARALLSRADPGPSRAARVSGRGAWARFLRVEAPRLAPATGLAFALGYLLTMRELDVVTLLPAGSGMLCNHIFGLVHTARDDMTAVMCLLLLALVLVPAVGARLLGVPGVDCGPDPSAS